MVITFMLTCMYGVQAWNYIQNCIFTNYFCKKGQSDNSVENLEDFEIAVAGSTYEENGTFRFCPPVYVQRYMAVDNELRSMESVKKVVELGCGEFFFFGYLKQMESVEEVMFVDLDATVLEKYVSKVKPLTIDYLVRRRSPLNIQVLQGNASVADSCLQGASVVVGVELIEHMFPEDLNELPYCVFGVIQPNKAIFTTPNVDFNVAFKSLKGFRHPDHKFEWSRQQFHDWAVNLTERFPEYSVKFYGVGPGPSETSHLGCCSQMVVFTRNELVPQNADSTLFKSNAYKLLEKVEYPFEKKPKLSQEEIIRIRIRRFLRTATYCDEFYQEDQDRIEVPVENLLSLFPDILGSASLVRKIVSEGEWIVETLSSGEEVIIMPPYGGSASVSSDEYSSEDYNQTQVLSVDHASILQENWDVPSESELFCEQSHETSLQVGNISKFRETVTFDPELAEEIPKKMSIAEEESKNERATYSSRSANASYGYHIQEESFPKDVYNEKNESTEMDTKKIDSVNTESKNSDDASSLMLIYESKNSYRSVSNGVLELPNGGDSITSNSTNDATAETPKLPELNSSVEISEGPGEKTNTELGLNTVKEPPNGNNVKIVRESVQNVTDSFEVDNCATKDKVGTSEIPEFVALVGLSKNCVANYDHLLKESNIHINGNESTDSTNKNIVSLDNSLPTSIFACPPKVLSPSDVLQPVTTHVVNNLNSFSKMDDGNAIKEVMCRSLDLKREEDWHRTLINRCVSLQQLKDIESSKFSRLSLCFEKEWSHLKAGTSSDEVHVYHETGDDSYSHSRAADSGYPNTSDRDMDTDMTPEQVDEILSENESSLEEEPINRPPIGAAPVQFIDNVENGDVANNNRDGEGNNLDGMMDINGDLVALLNQELGLIERAAVANEGVPHVESDSEDENKYISASESLVESNAMTEEEEQNCYRVNSWWSQSTSNSQFVPASSSRIDQDSSSLIVHTSTFTLDDQSMNEINGFPVWLLNLLQTDSVPESTQYEVAGDFAPAIGVSQPTPDDENEDAEEVIVPGDVMGGGEPNVQP